MNYKLTVSGKTLPIKGIMKSNGFCWRPACQHWEKTISDSDAGLLMGGTTAAQDLLKELGGRKVGCIAHVSYRGNCGKMIFAAKDSGYIVPTAALLAARQNGEPEMESDTGAW